jgi:hypothetical protein
MDVKLSLVEEYYLLVSRDGGDIFLKDYQECLCSVKVINAFHTKSHYWKSLFVLEMKYFDVQKAMASPLCLNFVQ